MQVMILMQSGNEERSMDLFGDKAAILNSSVSVWYCGMPRVQIRTNLPPDMSAVSPKKSITPLPQEKQYFLKQNLWSQVKCFGIILALDNYKDFSFVRARSWVTRIFDSAVYSLHDLNWGRYLRKANFYDVSNYLLPHHDDGDLDAKL